MNRGDCASLPPVVVWPAAAVAHEQFLGVSTAVQSVALILSANESFVELARERIFAEHNKRLYVVRGGDCRMRRIEDLARLRTVESGKYLDPNYRFNNVIR
jgi:hypothetical protein